MFLSANISFPRRLFDEVQITSSSRATSTSPRRRLLGVLCTAATLQEKQTWMRILLLSSQIWLCSPLGFYNAIKIMRSDIIFHCGVNYIRHFIIASRIKMNPITEQLAIARKNNFFGQVSENHFVFVLKGIISKVFVYLVLQFLHIITCPSTYTFSVGNSNSYSSPTRLCHRLVKLHQSFENGRVVLHKRRIVEILP